MCIVFFTAAKRMTKAALKNFTAEIRRKRREVSRLQEDLCDMRAVAFQHLDRARSSSDLKGRPLVRIRHGGKMTAGSFEVFDLGDR
ncbi:hypothetical protein BH18VER2_BH18VER2_15220 [soil metagenome]